MKQVTESFGSTKSQAPNSKEPPISNIQTNPRAIVALLKLEHSLELGVWDLELSTANAVD
jgi:hypothetical protein